MPEYIFRFPADTPPLTYADLDARCTRQNHADAGGGKIGTTVTLWRDVSDIGEPCVRFYLYDTELARIYPARVEFTEHGDRHMATTYWLGRIVTDNGIGVAVWTDHFVRYVIRPAGGDGRAPLEGQTFPVAAGVRGD